MSNEIQVTPPVVVRVEVGETISPLNLPPIPDDRLPPSVARRADLQSAMTDHLAAENPHVQYVTQSGMQAAIAAATANSDNGADAILDHVANADPHPQYLNGIEVATAINGAIAQLNLSQYMTAAQVQAAIATALASFTSSPSPSPAPAPSPSPTPSAPPPTVYTTSSSPFFNGHLQLSGSYQNLTDGSDSTGFAAANNTSTTLWLQATFPAPVLVSAVRVGGSSSLPFWGPVAEYLNGALIRHSVDGTNWTTIATVEGVTDSGASQFKSFSFNPTVARFWRLERTGQQLATTEFSFT